MNKKLLILLFISCSASLNGLPLSSYLANAFSDWNKVKNDTSKAEVYKNIGASVYAAMDNSGGKEGQANTLNKKYFDLMGSPTIGGGFEWPSELKDKDAGAKINYLFSADTSGAGDANKDSILGKAIAAAKNDSEINATNFAKAATDFAK